MVEHYHEVCRILEVALGRLLEPSELAKIAVLARGGVRLDDWRTAIDTVEPVLLGFPALLWTALTLAAEGDR